MQVLCLDTLRNVSLFLPTFANDNIVNQVETKACAAG